MDSREPGGANASQSRVPSDRRNAIKERRVPSSYAVVKKIRSPQTIGEEWPRPGTAVFHKIFSVADHLSGYPEPDANPCPEGPRHRGQYRAPSPSTPIIATLANSAGA